MGQKPFFPPLGEKGRIIAAVLVSALLVAALLLPTALLVLPRLTPVRRLLCAAVVLLAGLIALNLVKTARTGFGLRFGVRLFAVCAVVLFWLEAELFAPRTALLLANPLPLYLGAVVVGVLLSAAASVPWRKAHKGDFPLSLAAAVTISGFLLGRALLLDANLLLDSAPSQSVTVAATGVFGEPQGSYTHFYVTLEENSLLPGSARLPLTPQEYETAKAGDRFLLSVHAGALGIAWAGLEPVS